MKWIAEGLKIGTQTQVTNRLYHLENQHCIKMESFMTPLQPMKTISNNRLVLVIANEPSFNRKMWTVMRGALLLVLAGCLSGCTHIPLRNNTGRTSSTLIDIHYRQVLDNVARFHDNPDTVPSFAVVTAGTVSVSDQAGAGVSATYSPTLTSAEQGGGALPILSLLFPFNGQRSLSENWSLTPVTDADNLRRLRCAYRLLLLGKEASNYTFCNQQMNEFFAGEEANLAEAFPPREWFSIGRKKDVPSNACYVGSHANTYVWVTPEGMNGLAVFAMGALDLATGKMHTPQRTVVRKYKGQPTPENLVETQVTSTEDDEQALEAIRKGRTKPPEHERNLQPAPFNPGLLTLPH